MSATKKRRRRDCDFDRLPPRSSLPAAASVDPLVHHGMVTEMLHCHNCEHGFSARVDYRVDGNHVIVCPFCFAGEEQYLTLQGPKSFQETAGTRQQVLTAAPGNRRGGYWTEAEIVCFGAQPLLAVTVTRNGVTRVIHATAEHRWLVRHGWDPQREYPMRTADLMSARDRRLVSLLPQMRLDELKLSPAGVAHGITYGDGYQYSRNTCRVDLYGEKNAQLLRYFPGCSQRPSAFKIGAVPAVRVFGVSGNYKELPSLQAEPDYLFGFLAGLFAADGTVSSLGKLALTNRDPGVLSVVQSIAQSLGIASYGISTKQRRGCYGRGLLHEVNLARSGQCHLCRSSSISELRFVSSTVTEEFFVIAEQRERWQSRTLCRERLGWKVLSVALTDRVEPVYCAVVPETHTFALEGNIWTHNCGHQHCRVIHNGRVTGDRWETREETIEVMGCRWTANSHPMETSSVFEHVRNAWLERLR